MSSDGRPSTPIELRHRLVAIEGLVVFLLTDHFAQLPDLGAAVDALERKISSDRKETWRRAVEGTFAADPDENPGAVETVLQGELSAMEAAVGKLLSRLCASQSDAWILPANHQPAA